ncbi:MULTISPECIES: CDP-glycerol glycerophosphotransferase family protein [Staphylococcus]|nr:MULTISPECIES: CDP-glycerol glycerophosphotransferase family protein [Staphylococcus]
MKTKVMKKVKNFKNNKGKFIYVNSRRNKKIEKNTVILEGVHGATLNGHIYYLLNEIINSGKMNKIYVVLKDIDEIESFVTSKIKETVVFVKHLSHQYYDLLATTEYLINDTTFYPFFNKRRGQKYYIVWHGTPLKYMGKDTPKIMDIANVQRNFYMADRIYVSNKKTKDILARTYNLNNVYNGDFVIGPSPRNSVFFESKNRTQIRKMLQINDKKAIVYMPTWRGNVGNVKSSGNITQIITYLEENLDENTIVYVKLHPYEKVEIPDHYNKVKPYPNEYETYEVLTATDGLITDYSSVMYDYMNMNKPIILYTYDYKKYSEDRGLYDDLSNYPCEQVFDLEHLTQAIKTLPTSYDYSEMNQDMNSLDQENGSKIIVEHMLFNRSHKNIDIHNLHNGKETVLIVSGGFWSNGITTALINTLENIDTTKRNYICFFEKNKVKKEHYYRLLNLPENVTFYPTVGEVNGNFKDRLIMKQYLWNEKFNYKNIDKYLSRIYKEEFTRLFGDLKIDWFIHYTGFERKSAEMMRHINCKKAIWVHTDMFAEYEAKQNFSKKIIFGAYDKADKVVLVHQNLRENLVKHFPKISNKVVTVNNFLGEKRTRKLSRENLLESIDKANVDYSYNENLYLPLNSMDKEELELKAREQYPKKEQIKAMVTKNIESFEFNTCDKLDTHKKMMTNYINKSFDKLYQNFLLDHELNSTFKHLFSGNNTLIDEYFEIKEIDSTIKSVDFYKKMRISKCKMLDALFNPEIKVYMNIGRYDYQKGHDKLINSFEKIYLENPNVFLILVCPHGPLKSQTIQWVRDSAAKNNIIILGGINNPYPLLNKVDAFVLSSNYEGLGLVVYEALSLNTDVITVNLKETTEYLNDNQAIIVDNSVEGLYQGFRKHLEDEPQFEEFDFDYYREKSILEFQNAIQ